MLNLIAVAFSAVLFLVGAFITSRLIPEALIYTLAGLGAGCVLGLLGIGLTRWEYAGRRLQYTPNRWLVLTITVVVAARVLYGFWRTWEAWRASVDTMAWVAASGVATSMSAGAIVLGYYLIFWTGVRGRIRRHEVGPIQTYSPLERQRLKRAAWETRVARKTRKNRSNSS
jgi:hypothetical protein